MLQERPDLTPLVRQLPHKPGVYLFKDRLGRVIYVGKARDLHKRVGQYFHPSRRQRADLKTKALIESIWDLEHHVVKSEPESILLEGKLIKEYRPKYNISFRDDKRFLLVKVNLNDPFPRFQLTRVKKEDGCRYFGPFANAGALRRTLNLMRKRFGLRSCQPTLPDESDYRHCLDHVIQNCSAPCVNKISRSGYLDRIRQACEFLEGHSAETLQAIEDEMKAAASRLEFEKAAELRNMLEDLKRTTTKQKRFVRAFHSAIVPEKDLEELRDALQLETIPARIECFDISNISTTHKVASMVCFKNGKPDRYNYRRYRIRNVDGQNDFASMAEVVRRRYSRVIKDKLPMPDLIIVDGGKGQLSAAHRELQDLGLLYQPIIGLAKRYEEIFRPGNPYPLVFPLESGLIRLLQRVRDEAHRVANGYHQLLMKKRIAESVLDECPGLSEARKRALLGHFGSIEKIRQAPAEELIKVEGIGRKTGEAIVDFFERIRKERPLEEPASDEKEYILKPLE